MTKTVAQWGNGSLITFKMFPRYCPRLPHTWKKIKLHLQAFSDLICIQSSELHSIAKPQAFSDLKILVYGVSLNRNKFLTIPEDLVNEETINREVIDRGGRMSGGYITFIDAEDDFILNSHIRN